MPRSHAFVYVLRQETTSCKNVSLQCRNVSTAALEERLMKATVISCQTMDRARVLADEGQSRGGNAAGKPRNLDAHQEPKRRQVNGRRLALAMRRIPAGAPVVRNTYQRGAAPLGWQQLRRLSQENHLSSRPA